MQHTNSNRLWRIAFWVYVGALLIIFALAYMRLIPAKLNDIPYYDTIGHVVLLGLAAYLGYRASNRAAFRFGPVVIPLVPIIVFCLAIVEECLQSLSPYRTFDLFDLVSDAVGITLFCAIDVVLRRTKR
jgi:hypothetical protein